MYYEAMIDDGLFLVPLLVWVEEGEDAEEKIREAVAIKFPNYPIEELDLNEIA